MNNFHYYQDPLFNIAKTVLEDKQDVTLEEGVEEIAANVKTLKVGDKTNFGVVTEIGKDSITFKAKDLPKTKITFNQRKTASKDFVLDKLMKLKEETENIEEDAYTNAFDLNEAVALASDTLKGQILNLLALNASVRVAHWHASTKVNDHATLGKLYEVVGELLDKFVETEMGLSRSRNFISIPCTINADTSISSLISELRDRSEALLNSSKVLGAEDLVNIAADLVGAVNKAAYLLEL